MKPILLAAFLFGLTAFVEAQKKFQGYYIALNGDTVAGSFPHFKQWKNNPSVVQFETVDRQLVSLTPNNCKSFTVTEFDTYDVLETTRMTNGTSFKDDGHFTTETGDETYEHIKAFLLKIYKADTVSLYEFSDNIRDNYFLQTPAGLIELLYKIDFKKNLIIPDNRFKQQLRNSFASELNENKKLENKLNNLKYSQRELVSFLNDVHGSGVLKSKDYRPLSELVFMGGVSYNSFKINPYNPFWGFSTVKYNHSVYPLVGIGLTQYGSRHLSKYFVMVELKFTGFKNSGLDKSNKEWVIKSQIVAPGIGMGAKWISKEHFSWYTSLNTSFLLLLNNKDLEDHSNAVADARKLIINIGARTGISVNHFEIWGQYNPRIITHSSSSFSPKLNFIYTGISWKIPQKK